MKQNWKQRLIAAGVCGCLLLASALPASAADFAEDITPDMTMQEIRSDPVMQQSGLFLYGSFGEGTQWTRSRLENQTLQEYAWGQTVPETTAALNLAAQNVKDGVQVTWQVYSPEETEADPSLGCVQLFYFPGSDPDGKYAIVMGGPSTAHLARACRQRGNCMKKAIPCLFCATAHGPTLATMHRCRILAMR